MKNLINISVIFLCLSAFSNCKKKDTTKTYSPTCGGAKSYVSNVAPLIQSYCVSCHSNYNAYTQVKASSASIRNSIVNGSMPKGTTLSEDQKNSIVCWIDAGAPNN